MAQTLKDQLAAELALVEPPTEAPHVTVEFVEYHESEPHVKVYGEPDSVQVLDVRKIGDEWRFQLAVVYR